MADVIFLIVIISLYVLISFFVLVRRKTLIKKIEEESTTKGLKQKIKRLKWCSIVMLILISVSFIQLPHYVATGDVILFVNVRLGWFLLVYYFTLYTLIVIKPCLKEKESEE